VLIAPDLDLVVAVNNSAASAWSVANLFASAALPSCPGNPLVNDDDAEVEPNGTIELDVLANDPGAGDDIAPETLTIASDPQTGTVEIVDDLIEYTDTSGTEGTDDFTYVVCNASRTCAEATVTVTIAEPGPTVNPIAVGGVATERATRCSTSGCA